MKHTAPSQKVLGLSNICPLCRATEAAPFHEDMRRHYFICSRCSLVFVPPDQHLTLEEEKAEYDRHQNSPEDQGYRRFLSRLFDPVAERIPPSSQGLDFGSGPGPTLSVMFEEAGHTTAIYDPFYAPALTPLEQTYDFVTASEVVEHLRRPDQELGQLWSCLRPGGLLGIMTKRVIDQQAFAQWHYKADPTHVCFFSVETFCWLAGQWHADLTIAGKDVVLLRKKINSTLA